MKIGERYDLRNTANREFLQRIVADYGVSKNVNQVGSSILCKDDRGTFFELVTMHRTPHVVAICGGPT